MGRYLLKRLGYVALMLVLLSLIIFFVYNLMPVDKAADMAILETAFRVRRGAFKTVLALGRGSALLRRKLSGLTARKFRAVGNVRKTRRRSGQRTAQKHPVSQFICYGNIARDYHTARYFLRRKQG